jgi:Mrp family chromosome partitioning ATPase
MALLAPQLRQCDRGALADFYEFVDDRMIETLENKRLIFVTGKGGVGKSTVCAALGRALAARGRRTLVVETDAFSAMPDLLGVDRRGDGPQPAGENLWAENLEADECFVRTLSRFVPSQRIARAVVSNKVARVFFKAAPSVNEFVILDQIIEEADRRAGDQPAYDHVLVDLPASGHALTFLGVPQTLHGMMKVGPIAKRADHIAREVRDPANTAIVAVCLPEEMPVNETSELAANLRDTLGRGLTGAVVNMVHGLPVAPEHRETFENVLGQLRADGQVDEESIHRDESPALSKLLAGSALAMGWHDRDHHYLGLLRRRIDSPIQALPVVYEMDTAKIVDALAIALAEPVESRGEAAS